MKIKMLSFALICALLLTLSACNKMEYGASASNGTQIVQIPKFIKNAEDMLGASGALLYTSEPLPQTEGVEVLAVHNGTLYFVSNHIIYMYDTYKQKRTTLTELTTTLSTVLCLSVDSQDCVWLLCATQNDTMLAAFYPDGAERGYYNISKLSDGLVVGILCGSDGYIYMDTRGDACELIALDISDDVPRAVFQLDTSSSARLVLSSDGRVIMGEQTEDGYSLKIVDSSKQTWDYNVNLSGVYSTLFSGEGTKVYLTDNNNVYSYDFGNGEVIKIFNWIQSGFSLSQIMVALPDERFIIPILDDEKMQFSLSLLYPDSKTEDNNQAVTISLATLGYDSKLEKDILAFNASSSNIKVEVLDYSVYNASNNDLTGISKLKTKLLSGDGPDILDTSVVPPDIFAAAGLLENLYNYIDADNDITRDNLLPDLLSALDKNGKLYELVPCFGIMTVISNIHHIDESGSWTFEEFHNVWGELSDDTQAFDSWMTQNLFLEYVLAFNSSEYLDWFSKECHFDSQEFIRILELTSSFPSMTKDQKYNIDSNILNRKQLLSIQYVNRIGIIGMFRNAFGTDMEFVGFPSSDGANNAALPYLSLAICTASEKKDICWEFLRSFLLPEYQDTVTVFPIRIDSLEKQFNEYIDKNEYKSNDPKLDVDMARSLVDSINKVEHYDKNIFNIIQEEASFYFTGYITAENAAKLIQNRVSIYMTEQN